MNFDEFFHVLDQIGGQISDFDNNLNPACSVFDFCEINFLNLNETLITNLEKLMDEPKIHGDLEENFVLIPLCSFGNQILTNCTLFKPAKIRFQDDICYTFDSGQVANPEQKLGLNLVFNINNLPQIGQVSH